MRSISLGDGTRLEARPGRLRVLRGDLEVLAVDLPDGGWSVGPAADDAIDRLGAGEKDGLFEYLAGLDQITRYLNEEPQAMEAVSERFSPDDTRTSEQLGRLVLGWALR